MEICSGKNGKYHDEIVFEGRGCPLCDALRDISNMEKQIEELESRNSE